MIERIAPALAFLVSLGASWPASAKVSTSLVVCFAPGDASLSTEVSTRLSQFVERAKPLGPPSGLFIATVALANLEPQSATRSRIQLLLSRLTGEGFTTPLTDVRQLRHPSSDIGCPAEQVAVELEAIFPHDGYR